jgi:hypothetical protein
MRACDFCGAPRAGGERIRLVWDSGPDGDLVLADLCERCAGQADRLLEVYGGHGRTAIKVTRMSPVEVREAAWTVRIGGPLVRGLVYVLIALATFVVVTLLWSRG